MPQRRNEAFAKEMPRFIEKGTFEVFFPEELRDEANILGSIFILSIKDTNTKAGKFKALFIFQAHTSAEKAILFQSAPIISQKSIPLLVSVTAIQRSHLLSQEITQAYLPSAMNMSRDIFFRAPKAFCLKSSKLIKFLKPLYSLSDYVHHWHMTVKHHFRRDL